ncbi:MAG: long-chain fatty acid--CoA ligase [Bacteroidales bacterium]|nr:long-chain fatty acid--CoA ligase [Bacteroidales bacterium]
MKHFLFYVEEAIKNNWDKPAISNYGANTFTFAEVAANVARMHILLNKCNIKKGDHVAIAARSSAEWCAAFIGITSYGAVAVPLLPDFLPENLVQLTKLSGSRMLFVDKNILAGFKRDNLLNSFDNVKDFIGIFDIVAYATVDGCENNVKVLADELDILYKEKYPDGIDKSHVDYLGNDINALAVISYTSGTSSSPKGVMLPARSLSGNVEIARKLVPIAVKEPGPTLSILPLAHIFGLAFDFLFLFSSGCHINIFTEKPVPARLIKALADVKPFIFLTVPLLVEKIFRSKVIPVLNKPAMKILTAIPGVRQLIHKKIRNTIISTFGGNLGKAGFFIGGAAISKDVDRVMKRVGIPYAVGYGMTECGPLISYVASSHPSIDDRGGVAAPNIELRIDSDRPNKVPGEIQVRGDVVTTGYYNNEEATKNSFTSDGWLKTGDMGIQDRYGTVFIKGRCKNMILTGSGQNIYPEEIEDIINQIPYITESLIVGRNHALVALVVADCDAMKAAGIEGDAVQKYIDENVLALNAKLPPYSQIGRCELRKEPFEKTPKLSIKRFMYN